MWFVSSVAMILLAGSDPAVPPTRSAHGFTRNVAVLVFDGVELLDFAGPVETFTQTGGWDTPLRVYTVGPERRPLRTNNVVTVLPDFTTADCPPPDILVIPGGEVRGLEGDTPLARFIREQVPRVEIAFSVCNGVFCLADGGFLDGLEATTFHGSIAWLREAAPKTVVHADRRFVDNGHIVTAAGVSAGIDGALHLVHRLLGADMARRAARRMEYEWKDDPGLETAPEDAIERARRAWYAGRWKDAVNEYSAIAAARPDDAIAAARLGTALVFTRRNDEGLAELERAAHMGVEVPQLDHALGVAMSFANRHHEAVAALKRAHDSDPDSIEVLHFLGMEEIEIGACADGLGKVRRSWSLGRGDTQALVAIASAEATLGDREAALGTLEQIVARDDTVLRATLARPCFDALREEPRFTALARGD